MSENGKTRHKRRRTSPAIRTLIGRRRREGIEPSPASQTASERKQIARLYGTHAVQRATSVLFRACALTRVHQAQGPVTNLIPSEPNPYPSGDRSGHHITSHHRRGSAEVRVSEWVSGWVSGWVERCRCGARTAERRNAGPLLARCVARRLGAREHNTP